MQSEKINLADFLGERVEYRAGGFIHREDGPAVHCTSWLSFERFDWVLYGVYIQNNFFSKWRHREYKQILILKHSFLLSR